MQRKNFRDALDIPERRVQTANASLKSSNAHGQTHNSTRRKDNDAGGGHGGAGNNAGGAAPYDIQGHNNNWRRNQKLVDKKKKSKKEKRKRDREKRKQMVKSYNHSYDKDPSQASGRQDHSHRDAGANGDGRLPKIAQAQAVGGSKDTGHTHTKRKEKTKGHKPIQIKLGSSQPYTHHAYGNGGLSGRKHYKHKDLGKGKRADRSNKSKYSKESAKHKQKGVMHSSNMVANLPSIGYTGTTRACVPVRFQTRSHVPEMCKYTHARSNVQKTHCCVRTHTHL